ncbi:hypothetical protein ACSI5G_004316 [Vibrio vulnificus]|nr:hypothetical protein [Vibrio vulnificus]
MLNNYSDYIDFYLSSEGLKNRPCPGEHHFVSTYLLPRLFEINKRVPDYINPDGTKNVIGDVVYYEDHEHQFGIEVKLGTIRLTMGEFNKWIVRTDKSDWPHTFIAIGTKGIALCSWELFRNAYISAVKYQKKNPSWEPEEIDKGYGPQKSVNELLAFLPNANCHFKGVTEEESNRLEERFTLALAKEVAC